MNQAQFIISIKYSVDFFKKFDLYKSVGPKGNGVYSAEFIEVSRKGNLLESYKCAIQNLDYDVILKDDSILQFQYKNGELRYAFIQNPYKFVSKEEYITTIYSIDDLAELDQEDIDDLINNIDENHYEQFLNEQSIDVKSNYFRYDCSPTGYRPLIHSWSHLHIGPNENIRIPISKILTPLKFTKFCIKNTYYNKWKNQFDIDEKFSDEISKIKASCQNLDAHKWADSENNELYLS